jgi:rare lipoprotein A
LKHQLSAAATAGACRASVLLVVMLQGCGHWEREPAPVRSSPAAAPVPAAPPSAPGAQEPLSPYGNPEFYDVLGKRYFPLKSAAGFSERGIASWYGPNFHGGLTSTREAYDMYQMTAAHRVLPLPTWVEVTNLSNGRQALVRVNDRGPFKDNRVIDLSYAAALKLDMIGPGTAFVEIRAVTSSDRADVPVAGPPPPGPPPRMYLQVGAYGERGNAERMFTRLQATFGDEVRIYGDPPGEPRYYKVQLGPVRDVAHADFLVSRLEALGIDDHHFVNN